MSQPEKPISDEELARQAQEEADKLEERRIYLLSLVGKLTTQHETLF